MVTGYRAKLLWLGATLSLLLLGGCGNSINAGSSAQQGLNSIKGLVTVKELRDEIDSLPHENQKTLFTDCVALNAGIAADHTSGAISTDNVNACKLVANFLEKFKSQFNQGQFSQCVFYAISIDSHLKSPKPFTKEQAYYCSKDVDILGSSAVSTVALKIPKGGLRHYFYYKCLMKSMIYKQIHGFTNAWVYVDSAVLSPDQVRTCYEQTVSSKRAESILKRQEQTHAGVTQPE